MATPIFVVDTNVLLDWILSYTGNAQEHPDAIARSREARRFCENSANRIYIPGIAWSELFGVFLQKNINTSNYDRWRQQQQAALLPVERLVYKGGSHIVIGESKYDTTLSHKLCYAHIPSALVARLAESERRRSAYPGSSAAGSKLLDGMDAPILASAWQLAKEQPSERVVLLTEDRGLMMMTEWLIHGRPPIAGGAAQLPPTPPNLGCRRLLVGRR